MRDKRRFSFLLRPNERTALLRLAQISDRSQGATLRRLIRQAAQVHDLWPLPNPTTQDRRAETKEVRHA